MACIEWGGKSTSKRSNFSKGWKICRLFHICHMCHVWHFPCLVLFLVTYLLIFHLWCGVPYLVPYLTFLSPLLQCAVSGAISGAFFISAAVCHICYIPISSRQHCRLPILESQWDEQACLISSGVCYICCLFSVCLVLFAISVSFSMSGAVCDPTRPAPSLLLRDFKAPTEFSSSKKSNLLSGRFLGIRKLPGRPSSSPKGRATWCWLAARSCA